MSQKEKKKKKDKKKWDSYAFYPFLKQYDWFSLVMKETAQHRHYFLSKGMKGAAHNPEAVMFITAKSPRAERATTLLIGPGGNRALPSNNLCPSAVPCCRHLNRNLMLCFCHRFPIDLPGKQTNRVGWQKDAVTWREVIFVLAVCLEARLICLFGIFFSPKCKIILWHLVKTVLQKDRRGCYVFCQVSISSSRTHFAPFTSF